MSTVPPQTGDKSLSKMLREGLKQGYLTPPKTPVVAQVDSPEIAGERRIIAEMRAKGETSPEIYDQRMDEMRAGLAASGQKADAGKPITTAAGPSSSAPLDTSLKAAKEGVTGAKQVAGVLEKSAENESVLARLGNVPFVSKATAFVGKWALPVAEKLAVVMPVVHAGQGLVEDGRAVVAHIQGKPQEQARHENNANYAMARAGVETMGAATFIGGNAAGAALDATVVGAAPGVALNATSFAAVTGTNQVSAKIKAQQESGKPYDSTVLHQGVKDAWNSDKAMLGKIFQTVKTGFSSALASHPAQALQGPYL